MSELLKFALFAGICGTKNPSFDKQPNKIETELQTVQYLLNFIATLTNTQSQLTCLHLFYHHLGGY